VAATDFGRAERIVGSITEKDAKVFALSVVAKVMAATDPGCAERIAYSITNESSDTWVLRELVEALVAISYGADPRPKPV
jgi:hypothetical protein